MTPATVIVHHLEHARAALAAADAAGVPVVLRSAPGAAATVGAAFFRAMIDAARGEVPDADVRAVLDCGRDVGLALGALRHGIRAVRVETAAETRARLVDVAAQSGAVVEDPGDDAGTPVLDLLDVADPEAACRAWLTRTSGHRP